MKRYVYALCLMVSFAGLNSCKKESDPTPDPVVGKWSLERIRFSGYTAPFTSLNVDRPTSGYGISGTLTVKNDKSFTESFSNGIQVSDFKGTWDFTTSTLQLKYENGDSENYTLDVTPEPVQLISPAVSDVDSLKATATSPVQAVPFKYQFVYSKQ